MTSPPLWQADSFGANFREVVPKAVPKVIPPEDNALISFRFLGIGGDFGAQERQLDFVDFVY